MGLPVRDQVRYWGIAAAVFLGVLWALGDILLPFVVGGAVAYFLDPVVRRLQRLGLNRVAATALISLLAILALVLALLLIIPAVFAQAAQLFEAAPEILRQLQDVLNQRFPAILDVESAVRVSLAGLGEAIQARGGEVLQQVLTSARGVVSVVVFLVIAPVVSVYLLMDWPRLVERVDALLPRAHAPVIRHLASEVDAAIAGFVRGQLSVCLILAVYYASALMLAGLQYGMVVGMVAGLISFIPYIGAIIGGVLAIGLALFQFWGAPLAIGIVVAIFVVGQILEGNVLVPNMVGRSVGLHPVWLLLALSVFGAAFGFVGMLVAVPVAAALGVLVRFAAAQYVASPLYDTPPPRGDGDD